MCPDLVVITQFFFLQYTYSALKNKMLYKDYPIKTELSLLPTWCSKDLNISRNFPEILQVSGRKRKGLHSRVIGQ